MELEFLVLIFDHNPMDNILFQVGEKKKVELEFLCW